MVATSAWFISSLVAPIEGCSIHWMQCSGAPAATAASRTTRAACAEHCCAAGWKPNTIGFRVFRASRLLKIVVEVGLVTGVTPAMTPTGSAISVIPVSSSWEITPTVRSPFIECVTCSQAKMFFTALSSNRPRPVSATAACASWPCWSRAATAALATMWSMSSWVRPA